MDENLQYVEQNFVPQHAVLHATGLDDDRLSELIDRGLLPRACYFADDNGWIRSNLGGIQVALTASYFHPSVISHIGSVQLLLSAGADQQELALERRKTFVSEYVRHSQSLHALGLVEPDAWRRRFADTESLVKVAESEYEYWLDGTYGLCTRSNTPEAIAVKECMVGSIDAVTQDGERDEVSNDERDRLVRYIRLYDNVAALFAPFERAGSSRHRLCTAVPERYGLDVWCP